MVSWFGSARGERAGSVDAVAARNGARPARRGTSSPPASRWRVRSAGVLVAASVAVGCNDGGSAPAPPVPPGTASVEVIPATAWIPVGATLPLTGRALDAAGAPVSGVSLTWQSAAPSVATVGASGAVQGVAPGTARITASAGSLRAWSDVTVVGTAARTPTFGVERQGVTDVSMLGIWSDPATGEGFAVGQDGVVLQGRGGTWRLVSTGARETLVGVWGSSARNVFAVGTGGAIWRYDGTAWLPMPSPTGQTLLDVFGFGPNDVFAVGTDGTVLRFDGSDWRVITTGRGWELWAVWGTSPTDLWLAGQNGVIVRYDGTDFRVQATGTWWS